MTIYGTDGQVMQQRTQFNTPISMEKLLPGLYILKVLTGQRVHNLKVLKQ